MMGPTLDRRRFFLGSLSVSAAVLLGGELGTALAVSPAAAANVPMGKGHVDDMWGHWPPYAHPIPYGPYGTSASETVSDDGLDPVDRMWGSSQ